MWLQRYQHMTEKDYVPFNEFYRVLTQTVDQTPTKDVLAEVEQIRKKARKEGE